MQVPAGYKLVKLQPHWYQVGIYPIGNYAVLASGKTEKAFLKEKADKTKQYKGMLWQGEPVKAEV